MAHEQCLSAPASFVVARRVSTTVALFLLASAIGLCLATPARAQYPCNAAYTIGGGATFGGMLGAVLALISAADNSDWEKARWIYIGTTAAGTAAGTVMYAVSPEKPSREAKIGRCAAGGGFGGMAIGFAVGLMIEPDIETGTAVLSAFIGAAVGAAVGIWAGHAQGSGSTGDVATAAVTLSKGSPVRLQIPAPRIIAVGKGNPMLAVELISHSF